MNSPVKRSRVFSHLRKLNADVDTLAHHRSPQAKEINIIVRSSTQILTPKPEVLQVRGYIFPPLTLFLIEMGDI